MIILLWTDNLYMRTQLESAWKNAGADVLVKEERERMSPDLIVMDLSAADAMEHIRRARAKHPATKFLAFVPLVDGEAFKQARAAGATHQVARSRAVHRVLSLLA